MEARADYNNNPGNLRPPNGRDNFYEGQIGIDDKGFAIFDSPNAGERALRNDIKIKIDKGINTPEKFIDMYAPPGKDKYGDVNSEEARANYKIWLAHNLGLKSTTDPFPEGSVDNLFSAIKAFEGGTWNKPGTDKKVDASATDRESQVGINVPSLPGADSTTGTPPAGVLVGVGGEEGAKVPSQEINPLIASAAGSGLGTASGMAAATARAKIDAATEAYEAIKSRLSGTAAPEPGTTPGGKWGAKTGYGVGEGTVQETSSAYKRAMPQGKVSGRMAKLWGIPKPGESPQLTQRLIDRAAAQEALLAAQAAEKSRLSPAMAYGAKLLAMPVKGALTGATVGFGLADAYNRYFAQKDPTGAAISGAGTAAALASPFVASMGALPALSVAAPLYLAAKDRIEYLKKHPEEIRLETNQYDPMGNPTGGGLP